MSFKNSNQALQRFVMDTRYAIPHFSTIDAMLDARRLNSTIRETDISKEGKLRYIKISHYPIDCNASQDDCTTNVCDGGDPLEPVQEWFLVSRCIQSKPKTLNIDDVRDVDGNWNFSDHALAIIRAQLGSLNKQWAKELDALVLLKAGLHLDGNQYHRVTVSNTTTGELQPAGMWDIEQEFADGGYQTPFILGSKEVFRWQKAMNIATENTFFGQDYAKLGVPNLYYDTVLNEVVGSTAAGEYIITFDPNALKLVTYNENVGIFATDLSSPEQLDRLYRAGGTNYMRGVLRDPIYGILWDFDVKFDDCTNTYTFLLRLKWDIFTPKIESCNIEGVNGIMVYRTCPVVIAVCPTGDLPSPAVNSRTFSWTPGAIGYPFTVQQGTIGGIQNFPNVAVTNIADLAAALNEIFGTPLFVVSGSNIQYQGWTALSGELNNGQHIVTFA